VGTIAVNPPKTPVTEGSNGVATATIPNVCKMPGPPAPFVPAPLPNIGKSGMSPQGYSTQVTFEGKAVAITGASFGSMGDVASKGTGGGLVSANVEGPTKFVGPGSLNVKVEGKSVQFLGDQMLNNCGPGGSPANAATMMGVMQSALPEAVVGDSTTCPTCKVASGATKSKDAKPYDKFFSDSEKADLDAIGAANPDLAVMLPPKGAFFTSKSTKAAKAARQRFDAAKKKAGMTGGGEKHHPHSLKSGGCPIHQTLVEKPPPGPEKDRIDAVDKQIDKIVQQACGRN
jgi:hypothetical protein